MGILALLKAAGSAIIAAVLPTMGEKLVEKVNEHLGDEEKVDAKNTTGEELATKIEKLSPEAQQAILQSEIVREIEQIRADVQFDANWLEVQKHLINAEKEGSKTRPYIAIAMAVLVCIGLGMLLFAQGYIIYTVMKIVSAHPEKIATAKDLLPKPETILFILGTPIWLIRSYFGDRTQDKLVRAQAATRVPIQAPDTVSGALGSVVRQRLLKS